MVVGISIGEYELFSHAAATAEDDRAVFPVHTRIMVFEPVMSEINVLLSKVHYGEVNAFAVFSNHHWEFYELCDIPALVAGSIGVIDQDGNKHLFHVEVVFLDVCLIDGASGTATVDQGFRRQLELAWYRLKSYGDWEISRCSADIADRFLDLIESFDGGGSTDSEFFEKLVSEFSELVFVHPKHKLGAGSIVATHFLDVL